MDPVIPDLEAIFTTLGAGNYLTDLIQMRARPRHMYSSSAGYFELERCRTCLSHSCFTHARFLYQLTDRREVPLFFREGSSKCAGHVVLAQLLG